jgi:pimeloyl-ACP methyl ester carboxylesterase
MSHKYKLNYKTAGKGPIVVMLHGLAGTSQYFDRITKFLPNNKIISIDLLGFGDSPKPKYIKYTIQDHLSAIENTIESLNIKKPFDVLGVSMGAVLALEYAKQHPKNIKSIVLVSPAIYSNAEIAKNKIDSTRAPNILMFGPVAKFVCKNICARQELAKKINPIVMRHIPSDVAKTVCEHTWESYSYSMQNVVINQPKQNISAITNIPLFIIFDSKDILIEQELMKQLVDNSSVAKIINIDGGHGMLVNNTALVADTLVHLL